ncbi:hypothetical protein FZEAL_9771, partial [Fusarium zealandicum]
MQGFLLLGAAAMGMANAMEFPRGYNTTEEMTTSTIYSTELHTVTSCAPEVTNCPNGPHVVTKTVPISTTVCPVTAKIPQHTGGYEEPSKPGHEDTTQMTTSTIYTTNVRTVTSCGPEVTDCPNKPHVTTETVAISTTVCPVSEGTVVKEPSTVVVPPKPTQMTTSTIYTTNVRTVTSCGPEVPDCPNKPHVTTETVAVSTTVCPVTETEEKPAPPPHTAPVQPPQPPYQPGNMTSTLYATQHYTISKCPPEVPDCPVGKATTTVYATGTTHIQQWKPTTKVQPPPQPPVETKPVEQPAPSKPVETHPV